MAQAHLRVVAEASAQQDPYLQLHAGWVLVPDSPNQLIVPASAPKTTSPKEWAVSSMVVERKSLR